MPTFKKTGGKSQATFELDDKVLQKIIKNVANQKVDPWTISDGVEYGIYVEFGFNATGGGGRRGTKRSERKKKKRRPKLGNPVPARPTLRPAFETVQKTLPEAIGQAVEKAIDLNDVMSLSAFKIKELWQLNIQDVNAIDTGAYFDSIEAKKGKGD